MLRVLGLIESGESGLLSDTQAHPVQPPPHDVFVMRTTLAGKVKLYKVHVDNCALRLLWPKV